MNAIAPSWNRVVTVSGGPTAGTTAGRVYAMPARKITPITRVRTMASPDVSARRRWLHQSAPAATPISAGDAARPIATVSAQPPCTVPAARISRWKLRTVM